jgi:lipopolysaccharide assembly outer membrane protein LptD (OstA)
MTASLTITKNWSVSVRNEFDVSAGKFIHTDLNIHRDLHCWEMGLNLIPYGPMKSYNFRINIKSSVFKGIEYKKQRSRLDNYD